MELRIDVQEHEIDHAAMQRVRGPTLDEQRQIASRPAPEKRGQAGIIVFEVIRDGPGICNDLAGITDHRNGFLLAIEDGCYLREADRNRFAGEILVGERHAAAPDIRAEGSPLRTDELIKRDHSLPILASSAA